MKQKSTTEDTEDTEKKAKCLTMDNTEFTDMTFLPRIFRLPDGVQREMNIRVIRG